MNFWRKLESLTLIVVLQLRGRLGLPFEPREAIRCVREHYTADNLPPNAPESAQMKQPGQFTYTRNGRPTVAMAAAGVVCLQEFGQYDDW